MKCPYCQTKHPDNAKFCPVTGNPLNVDLTDPETEKICPACGNLITLEGKFCTNCGYKLVKRQSLWFPRLLAAGLGFLIILITIFFIWPTWPISLLEEAFPFVSIVKSTEIAGESNEISESLTFTPSPFETETPFFTQTNSITPTLTKTTTLTPTSTSSPTVTKTPFLNRTVRAVPTSNNSNSLIDSYSPCISYYEETAGNLKFACLDKDRWIISFVDTENDVGSYSSLDFDSNGNAHISYFDITNADLKYAYQNGANWEIETVDQNGSVGLFTSISLTSDNQPVISYYDQSNGFIKIARKDNGFWDFENVDKIANPGQLDKFYSSVKVNQDDEIFLAFWNLLDNKLKLAKSFETGWDIQIVDDNDESGLYCSLALDSLGNPAISYYDNKNKQLLYTFWSQNEWQQTVVDNNYKCGKFTSLEFTPENKPCISYFDEARDNLKYAKWTGSYWNYVTVDSYGSVGTFTSLDINSEGKIYIAYYDIKNENLKQYLRQKRVTKTYEAMNSAEKEKKRKGKKGNL